MPLVPKFRSSRRGREEIRSKICEFGWVLERMRRYLRIGENLRSGARDLGSLNLAGLLHSQPYNARKFLREFKVT